MKKKIWIWIPPITPYILERGNEWITNPIHLQLLNILIYQLQGNNTMSYSIPLKSSFFNEWLIKLFEIFFPKI
jgi:hypothetical protein